MLSVQVKIFEIFLLQKFLLCKNSYKDVGIGLQRWSQQNLYLYKTFPGIYSTTSLLFHQFQKVQVKRC